MSAAFTALSKLEQYYSNHAVQLPLPQLDNKNCEHNIVIAVGAQKFSLAMQYFSKIILWPEFTQVPGTVSWFLGVANIDNQIITVNDLSGFITGKNITTFAKYLLVVQHQDLVAGLLVHDILGLDPKLDTKSIEHFDIAALAADPRFINIAAQYRSE
ncbi:MAG: hypothetical protein COC15_02605 [Legionellales bacterium]|nr:MAG: hypothetical protein COC15_02605 [Legionellales bacterium]